MKTFLTIFILFTALFEPSYAGALYSAVCGHKYTEGRMKVSTNRQIKYECLKKSILSTVYVVHSKGKCNKTHTEGQKILGRNGVINKECILTKAITDFYDVDSSLRCKSWSMDSSYHFINVDGFSTKRCYLRN